mgnify:CR=1 FL=1
MPLTKLEHYLVMTDDIDATRDFYRDVIGLEVGFRAALGQRPPQLVLRVWRNGRRGDLVME